MVMIDTKHSASLYVGYLTALDKAPASRPSKNQNPETPPDPNSFEALASAAGRALAALRTVREKECPVCHTRFVSVTKARYCSDTCRCKAWRKSRKDAADREK